MKQNITAAVSRKPVIAQTIPVIFVTTSGIALVGAASGVKVEVRHV